jgi:hypothetical protein
MMAHVPMLLSHASQERKQMVLAAKFLHLTQCELSKLPPYAEPSRGQHGFREHRCSLACSWADTQDTSA